LVIALLIYILLLSSHLYEKASAGAKSSGNFIRAQLCTRKLMNKSLEGTRNVIVLKDFNFTIFSISFHTFNVSSVFAISPNDSFVSSWLA
jgi:hypothetical protein